MLFLPQFRGPEVRGLETSSTFHCSFSDLTPCYFTLIERLTFCNSLACRSALRNHVLDYQLK